MGHKRTHALQQTVRSNRSSGGKSNVSPLADDDVIVRGNTERLRDGVDLLRHLDVRARRCRDHHVRSRCMRESNFQARESDATDDRRCVELRILGERVSDQHLRGIAQGHVARAGDERRQVPPVLRVLCASSNQTMISCLRSL